jgi:predicted GIY-YIG superfamily endonuclease
MIVYLLQSKSNSQKHYIGKTSNLEKRLQEHNSGQSRHTAKFRPWKVVVSVWFDDDEKAAAFEKYLKIGSGHAFAKRHFW